MEIITGKEFRNMVLGSGLKMCQVYKAAEVSSGTVHSWINLDGDMKIGTFTKLMEAYNKLKPKN